MKDFDDNKPTVFGDRFVRGGDNTETRVSGTRYGSSSGEGRETRVSGVSGFSTGREEHQTMIRRVEPEISAVAWLYCRKGLRKGQLYQMKKRRNEFGQSSGLDIPIEDDFASGHHGAILLEETAWKLYDFASTNGTFINGKRLGSEEANPVMLKDGDVISVGDTELVFKMI